MILGLAAVAAIQAIALAYLALVAARERAANLRQLALDRASSKSTTAKDVT